MRAKSILSCAALLALTVASSGASAAVLTVVNYDMQNGRGQEHAGTFDYLDHAYLPNVGNAANTPDAHLSGGTGLLTDGVIPTSNWSQGPTTYVGWKYFDPIITFNIAGGANVGEIDVYASGDGGAFGLVGLPDRIFVNGVQMAFSVTNVGDPEVDKLTILFGGAGISGTNLVLQLFAGSCASHPDCAGYPFPNDPNFKDTRTGQQTTVEPWLMVSEVQFLSAVPEPSTWAMMLIGFAALAFAGYRRQKKGALANV